ncbi:MAG: hypothetical protein ACTSYC_10725 [Promethearchaeota archaeon]
MNIGKKGNELFTFEENLFSWVDSFKLPDQMSRYSVIRSKNKPSLYGITDMIFNLSIPQRLEEYFSSHPDENKESWISHIQSHQNPKTGWFKEGLINYGFHFKEHSTAFAISALHLLGGRPKYSLKIANKLNTRKKVEKWLKNSPEWGLLYWPGSHKGGGIAAAFATLGPESYPHEKFFEWYFNWLDACADPDIGFWRLSWIHRINKKRLTINELGGAVHYYWMYEYMGHPFPHPEKIIDATLSLQNEHGLWDGDVSYCIDLDAIFCLLRSCRQAGGYRKEDIQEAVKKYLRYVIPTLNDKRFLFEQYTSAHKLTGCLEAIAEIQKHYPWMVETWNPWQETLDKTPWI